MKIKFTLILCYLVVSSFCMAQQDIFDISRNGSVEDLQKLYEKDSDCINTTNAEGYSPLILACYSGNTAIVKFLVDKVANIDGISAFGTPLMAAVVKGNTDITELLLKHKANPNIADKNGTTAAHYAVMFKHYKIIKLLLNAKADFNIKNNDDKSAMDYATMHNDDKINQLLKI